MQDVDPEKVENGQPHSHSTSHRFQTIRQTISATPSSAFIGRLGGNQEFVIDPDNAANAKILERTPDAAPGMTLRQQFDCKPFVYLGLWKAAFIEGVGKSGHERQKETESSRHLHACLRLGMGKHQSQCYSTRANTTIRIFCKYDRHSFTGLD